ncbi:MAG: hypothetical protein HQK96_17585 [Nitrospirae bacterium]|nr:hypothetical protein [Nitrospirota bacterium]
MKDMTIVAIIFVILIVLAVILIVIFNGDKARRRRFLGRAELSPDEFYQQYYETSGLPKDQVIEILNNIAYVLAIPAAQLRPTDRFTEELKSEPGWEFDDGLGILELELDHLFRKKGLIQIPEIKNIDDYIRFIIAIGPVEPECYQRTQGTLITAALAVIIFLIYLLKGNLWAAFFWLIVFIILYYTIGKFRGAG